MNGTVIWMEYLHVVDTLWEGHEWYPFPIWPKVPSIELIKALKGSPLWGMEIFSIRYGPLFYSTHFGNNDSGFSEVYQLATPYLDMVIIKYA